MIAYHRTLILLAATPLFAAFLAILPAHAETTNSEWGPISNKVQMSLSVYHAGPEVKTNQPVTLLFRFRNLSSNETFHINNAVLSQSSADIVTPSGTIPPQQRNIPGSGHVMFLGAGQTMEYEVPLGNFVSLNETGKYVIVINQTMDSWRLKSRTVKNGRIFEENVAEEFTVISNPLELNVTPGEWKGRKPNMFKGW